MNYQEYFTNNIALIKQEDRYREFKLIEKNVNTHPEILLNNDKNTVWCSNDYLGMSINNDVIEEFTKAAEKYGVGSGGTRNITGNHIEIVNLENKIAKFHNKDGGLVFTSGYVANLGAISALVQIIPDLVIFSDEKNHASIISGIRYSRVKYHIFKHNDCKHLEELLAQYHKNQPKLIIFESVYSMDSDTSDINRIVELAKEYNAMTYIDEVHSVGLYGDNGRGFCDHYGLSDKIDIIQGTFGKSFGVIGGYIVCNSVIRDAIRLNASAFIFTTSLPPAICAAISKSIDIVSEIGNDLISKHFEVVDYIKRFLRENDIKFLDNEKLNTHIIPIIISGGEKCKRISTNLQEKYGLHIQHINYPTVPKGLERLRITTSSKHTVDQAMYLCDCLKKEIKLLDI